jgi:hypothetical protein
MISGFPGMYSLQCDTCGAEAEETFEDFYDAVEWKKDKDNGWKSIRVKGDWEDLCPDCDCENDEEEE